VQFFDAERFGGHDGFIPERKMAGKAFAEFSCGLWGRAGTGYNRRHQTSKGRALIEVSVSFSQDAIVVAAKEQVSCELGGEAAILHMERGTYYGLDVIGAEIWKRLQTPVRVGELREFVMREYDVELAQCEQDLATLLEKLSAEGLIRVVDAGRAQTKDGETDAGHGPGSISRIAGISRPYA
jgi:hypothetical protein